MALACVVKLIGCSDKVEPGATQDEKLPLQRQALQTDDNNQGDTNSEAGPPGEISHSTRDIPVTEAAPSVPRSGKDHGSNSASARIDQLTNGASDLVVTGAGDPDPYIPQDRAEWYSYTFTIDEVLSGESPQRKTIRVHQDNLSGTEINEPGIIAEFAWEPREDMRYVLFLEREKPGHYRISHDGPTFGWMVASDSNAFRFGISGAGPVAHSRVADLVSQN